MKLSDYIVEFMVRKGVQDFFGYQGTMIAHFVDSIERNPLAKNHSCYNEQGAAYAACGYAQTKDDCACAYATSGPGAVNLISGIANAYFDSQPVIFFTGQLNTYEYQDIPGLRQHAFQEMDIVSMVVPVTKYCIQIKKAEDIVKELNRAYYIANTGRKGPVLIDLPMDIQRAEVSLPRYELQTEDIEDWVEANVGETAVDECVAEILKALQQAERPAIMIGNGVCDVESQRKLRIIAERFKLPIITSALAKSAIPHDHSLNFGCIGSAYGHRYANMIANVKSDLLICFGISLVTRQIGVKTKEFAKNAKIIRIDIDSCNLQREIHENNQNEWKFMADARTVIEKLYEKTTVIEKSFDDWLEVCKTIKNRLCIVDKNTKERYVNQIVENLSADLGDVSAVAIDVGQHMIWGFQSFLNKEGQKILFSGGHGAMGYALPAAIGAYYATGKPVACICGDGAMQMNIQELQWVARDQIPMKMIVMNNDALGLIRQQQEGLFNHLYAGSLQEGGFTSCSFQKVANAYEIKAVSISSEEALQKGFRFCDETVPELLEVLMESDTYAYPKTNFGEEIHNQYPYIPKSDFEELLKL